MNEQFTTAPSPLTSEMPNKMNQRVDRENYEAVEREEMVPGEVYAEFRHHHRRDDFDPVIHVEYSTATCSDCGSVGRYDEDGFVLCDNETCGMLISTQPMMVAANDPDMLQSNEGTVTDPGGAVVGVQ